MSVDKVVLISIDDLRFDCISCERDNRWLQRYGAHHLVDTPVIDSLARRGVRFTQCVSTSSYTPSPHASMLTGLYPKHHKVKTFFTRLPQRVVTLPEILREKGWETSAWCEHLTFKLQNITRGIDRVVEPFETESSCTAFIDALPPRNSFVFIHLFDVHKPYLYTKGGRERLAYNEDYLPVMRALCEKIGADLDMLLTEAEKEARRVVKRYDLLQPSLREYALYRSLDYLLRNALRAQGRLFEEMVPLYVRGAAKFDQGRFKEVVTHLEEGGFLENSLVFILSDHGETRCAWSGREDFMNSFNVSEGAIHVPFIVCGEVPEGMEVGLPVSVNDVVPTVLDFLHIDCNSTFDGISLIPLFEGDECEERTLFSESWAYQGESTFFGKAEAPLQEAFLAEASARKGGYKYVWRSKRVGESAGYHYGEDPFEEREVTNEWVSALQNEMHTYQLELQLQNLAKRFRL